jgi:hypothetical protein
MPAVALITDIVLNDVIQSKPGMEAGDDQEGGQQGQMERILTPAQKVLV